MPSSKLPLALDDALVVAAVDRAGDAAVLVDHEDDVGGVAGDLARFANHAAWRNHRLVLGEIGIVLPADIDLHGGPPTRRIAADDAAGAEAIKRSIAESKHFAQAGIFRSLVGEDLILDRQLGDLLLEGSRLPPGPGRAS